MPAYQVCCLNDEAIAHAQRGSWRSDIGLLPVINIDAREGYLDSGVSILQRTQYLRVHHAGQNCPVHHCLHQCIQLFSGEGIRAQHPATTFQ